MRRLSSLADTQRRAEPTGGLLRSAGVTTALVVLRKKNVANITVQPQSLEAE